MLHTKYQGHQPSGSGEAIFKGFYNIWAWRSSWSCDQSILQKLWLTYHKESSHENWVHLDRWFVRKLCFNILMGLQYERPKLKGQPWPLELTVNPLYNDTLYNSKILYNVISICTKVQVKLKIEFITTEIQFNIKLLGDKHCLCKEGWLYLKPLSH